MSKPLNLRRARHRRRPDTPDQVERVAAITRTARTTWLGLLSYLAFVGITLMGVQDADFFLTERETTLPLIGVSVPTNLFFYIAPTLGAMLYIHMHLYLLKLWKALAELPSDGTRPAGEGIAPWIVSDMALAQRDGAIHAYPLRSLARWVAILSIFAAGPLVLAAFWWRSMPKHDEVLTILACGLPLFATVLAGWESGRALRRGGAEARHMRRHTKAGWGTGLAALSAIGFLTTEGTFETYAQIDRVNLIVAEVKFDSFYDQRKAALVEELKTLDTTALEVRFAGITDYPDPRDTRYLADRLLEREWWMRTWLPGWLRPAQLQGVVFVKTPPDWLPYNEAEQVFRRDWCADQSIPPLACGLGPLVRDGYGDRIAPPDYIAHQRSLWCKEIMGTETLEHVCAAHFAKQDGAYTAKWIKARSGIIAILPKRDLSGADLRKADLSFTRLEGANLRKARMTGVNLREAQMERADLAGAKMERARLLGVRMEGADLRRARMEGAMIALSWMTDVDIREAKMEGAVLWQVIMNGAKLGGANMAGTSLNKVRMDRHTSFDDFTIIPFSDRFTTTVHAFTYFSHAALQDADYSDVRIPAEQVNSAFGDASVTLPLDIARPVHWPERVLPNFGKNSFKTEWRKWQADPEGYVPPPAPGN